MGGVLDPTTSEDMDIIPSRPELVVTSDGDPSGASAVRVGLRLGRGRRPGTSDIRGSELGEERVGGPFLFFPHHRSVSRPVLFNPTYPLLPQTIRE